MHTIAQDLAESLDIFTTHMKSIQLETITQKSSILDKFRKNLLDKVRSGYVPCTNTEVAEIEMFSRDSHLLLESLTGAITQTNHILQKLKEVETANAAFDCAQTLLFSPIRKLPMEILTKVFHDYIFSQSDYALRIENETTDFETMDSDSDSDSADVESEFGRVISSENTACPSLRLGWICSHWRSITLSEPRFWSSIYIKIDFHPRGSFLKLCQEFLSRSGHGPLVLHITTWNHESSHLGDLGDLLNLLLREYSTRWVHVTLGVSTSWYAQATRLGQVAFPNLKHLDVVNTYRDPESYHIDPDSSLTSDLFASCPKLETYVGDFLNCSILELHDFSHLTTLSLEELHTAHIAPFLSLLPALKTLSLRLDAYLELGDPPEETIGDFSHVNLSALSLTTTIRAELWRGVRLPKLDTYELMIGRPRYDTSRAAYLSEMPSLFHRSGCILKDVTFSDIDDASEMVSFIRQHPSITFLTIRTRGLENQFNFWDQLISSSQAATIVPKLQSLTIDFGSMTPEDLSELAGSPDWLDKLAEIAERKAACAASAITMDCPLDTNTVVRLKEFTVIMNPSWHVYDEDSKEQTHPDKKSEPKPPNRRDRQLIEDIKSRVESLHVGFTLRWGDSFLYQASVERGTG